MFFLFIACICMHGIEYFLFDSSDHVALTLFLKCVSLSESLYSCHFLFCQNFIFYLLIMYVLEHGIIFYSWYLY